MQHAADIQAEEWARFQATRDDVTMLKNTMQVFQRDMVSLNNSIERLVSRFDETRRTNWPMLASMFGLTPMLAAACLFVVSGQIAAAVQPIGMELAQLKVSLTQSAVGAHEAGQQMIALTQQVNTDHLQTRVNEANLAAVQEDLKRVVESAQKSALADVNSQVDRTQVNQRVGSLETAAGNIRAAHEAGVAELGARLLEIETQFKGLSNLSNQWRADQLRWDSILFEKAFPGTRFPNETAFFPQMYQDHTAPIGR